MPHSGTCPICCCEATDLEILEHWEAKGDISEHKMCGDCRRKYDKNQCPFCKEILHKEEIINFIAEFVDSVSNKATANMDDYHNRDACAAILERWQFLEMEYEGQPDVIKRIAKLVATDKGFTARLDQAVKQRAEWLREASGIVFRLHAMHHDGELDLQAADGKRLDYAIQAIFGPLEASPPQVAWLPKYGHPLGALYTQALVPWLIAWRSNGRTDTAQTTVQRAGRVLVHCWNYHGRSMSLRREVTERIHAEYMTLSHTPVWESQPQDIVWMNFFATNTNAIHGEAQQKCCSIQ